MSDNNSKIIFLHREYDIGLTYIVASYRADLPMQPSDTASDITHEEGHEDYFVYYEWMKDEDVPMDVTHVRIDSSVRRIKQWAFEGRGQLSIVILNDGLEEIGRGAFGECASLEEIVIPNSVKTIQAGAFRQCRWLTTLTLGNGLEEIGANAFGGCESIEQIVIPPAVKKIDNLAFQYGLLTSVKFSDEIEKFVSCEAMRDWWNQGVNYHSMRTYCCLVRCNIPTRVSGLALVSSWQTNIQEMMRCIPTVPIGIQGIEGGLTAYFDTIDAKLTMYETLLSEAPTLFPEQFGLDHGVVSYILSYL
jgi:hypothetical protein